MQKTETEDMVEIPFEYLLAIHIQMNAMYDKLKEPLGDSEGLSLMALSANAGLTAKQPTPSASIGELRRVINGVGYELAAERKGNLVTFRLACPYADRIHPHLGNESSFCPMSQTVLSTMRKKYFKSTITSSKLVHGGSLFSIEVQD